MADANVDAALQELANDIEATFGFNPKGSPAGDETPEDPETSEELEASEEDGEEGSEEGQDGDVDDGEEDSEEDEVEEDDEEEDEGEEPAGIKALSAQLTALEERLAELSKVQKPATEEKPTPPSTPTLQVPEVPDFVTEDDFQDVVTDPKAFNRAVNKAVKWALEEALKSTAKSSEDTLEQARQTIRSEMPQIMRQVQLSEKQQQTIRDQFWSRNKDTLDGQPNNVQTQRRRLVANIAQDVASNNPSYTFDQLSREVEKQYREALGMGKAKADSKRSRKKGKKPRQASSNSRRPSGGVKSTKEVAPNSPEDIAATFGPLRRK